jgi:hypothetical protein
MKSATSKILAFAFALMFSASLLPTDAAYGRGGGGRGGGGGRSVGGGGGGRSVGGGGARSAPSVQRGASPRVNSNVDLGRSGGGNINGGKSFSGQARVNESGISRSGNQRPNSGNLSNRSNDNSGNRLNADRNLDRNVDRNTNRNVDRNVNRTVNRNTDWYGGGCRSNCWGAGGGWYGRGYYTPPGWGLATFGAGLAIGAAVNSAPPYYDTVYVGSSPYIYSDGIYMQPEGSSYVVVNPPTGAVVSYLPEGCNTIPVGSTVNYDCSGIIYEPFYQDGATVYKVVRYS